MDTAKVEALLRQDLSFLSGFPIIPQRNHILEEVACEKCGVITTLVRKRCSDQVCRHCIWRFKPLCRLFEGLVNKEEIVPSHLTHLILPYRPIALRELQQDDVTSLQKSLRKFRGQTWFKRVIEGGYYHIELSVNSLLQVRLHVHLLLQTYQPAKSRPINIVKADEAWVQLTGQRIQTPKSLTRYDAREATKQFRYICKSLRGEEAIPILKDLDDYAQTEGEYHHSAQQLRVFVIQKYNSVFRGRHKRCFFGAWYGKGHPTVTHAEPVAKPQYRCHCGSKSHLASAVAERE